MLPNTIPGAVILLLAIAPGFIAVTVWARTRTWGGPSSELRTLLQSVAASLVIQAALSPLTLLMLYPIRDDLLGHPVKVVAWFIVVVLLVPFIGGRLAGLASDSMWKAAVRPAESESPAGADAAFGAKLVKWLGKPVPPSAWDSLWTHHVPSSAFVLIEFDDGSKVAGAFAANSAAITSPEKHGVYLEREWAIDDDGNITVAVPGSQGVMVLDTDHIRSIRVYEGDDDASRNTRGDPGGHSLG